MHPTKKRNQLRKIVEFVQDFIPIKDIKNGIIETDDGRYVKILEIEPINFLLRSSEEQCNIISSYANWLKISPVKLQFKSITRKAESDKHVAIVKEELKNETNPKCREMGEEYIKLIQDVGNKEALTRRFFLYLNMRPFEIRLILITLISIVRCRRLSKMLKHILLCAVTQLYNLTMKIGT